MASNSQLLKEIETTLASFGTTPLPSAALALFATLGYRSERTIAVPKSSPRAFLELFAKAPGVVNFDQEKALISEWKSVDLLFQLTDQEIKHEPALFPQTGVSTGQLRSYVFIAIELKEGDYARGKFSAIARQINRLFPMPVMVLFKHLNRLTIAVINRRVNKVDESKDVLGKVTLIREIDFAQPHRGHIDILASLALPNLVHPQRKAIIDFDTLHAAWEQIFNVELLNERFYRELANWYFWALPQVEFPADLEADGEKRHATGLIRLLTRLIFCWFLKEKGLIPEKLFHPADLAKILKGFDPESEDSSTYYQAILQNLFFATLNQRMGKDANGQSYRRFVFDEGFLKNKVHHDLNNFYRYDKLFRGEPETALSLFADVPFLNGGLFECLDKRDEDQGKTFYLDGFSRNPKKRALVPDRLFFDSGETADLSAAYGDTKRNAEKVTGLISILNRYKFTIVENTPIDQEIALDPELLGKVFENLLASYNEETKTTARKQTGSFYTPRPIVDYMVDGCLKAHLGRVLVEKACMKESDANAGLDLLFAYTEKAHAFSPAEVATLIAAVDALKILDPACGSGAFPMGVLHKLVYILGKLDPDNERWKQTQLAKLDSAPMREELERAFTDNNDDYGRKLYLIENCLYGADIQPIAIQITKLRFFISLVCDQKTNRNKKENHGIRPLPNLETKFVAADTLIGLPEMDQMELVDPRVFQIETEIETLYHSHFAIQRRDQKLALQRRIKALRTEMAHVLAGSLMSRKKSEHIAEWDPFSPQSCADFFDPHWMFGRSLKAGFDIILGNPPYLNVELVDPARKVLFAKSYKTFFKRYDVFGLFVEAALIRHSNSGGVVAFIVPQQIANNLSYKKLRDLILENRWLHEVLYLGDKVFKAASNDVCVLFLTRSANKSIRLVNALDFNEQATTIVPVDHFSRYANIISFSGDARGEDIFGKVFSTENRWLIKERFSVFQGIVTGNNAAFLPTPEQIRNAKIEKALLHPIVLGRDFEKWSIRSMERRIIYTDADTDIDQFPNTKKWLQPFRSELETRRECVNGVIPWFSLQWPRPKADLDRVPKILLQRTRNPRLKTRIVATIDETGIYGMESVIFLSPRDAGAPVYFLLAVLNSVLINYLYATKFLNVAVKAEYLKSTPIPRVSKREEDSLATLSRCVLTAKRTDEGTPAAFFEDLIDACVMECYFREHMAERNLLLLDTVAQHLAGYDSTTSLTRQQDFLVHLHRTLNAPSHPVRNRLLRLAADSPDFLGVIKAEGRA
jgi:adenine-specific DNA-methyltransferase